MIYVVTMYRWGSRENHSYILGAYSTFALAEVMMRREENYRGGKYEGEVLLVPIDALEEEPYTNYSTEISNVV